ncbi:MAG: DUF523 domain-containing protein [Clostridia bacterium]|nr:DUF523 domain-containing protein [Clostridia bacterium]
MDNVLISACLLSVACRYDGLCRDYDLKGLDKKFNLIPICPEIYGGLPTPRVPSEIVGERVLNAEGKDVTAQYEKGAREALLLAKRFNTKYAVLKAKSPSCGKGWVYDGTFSRKLTKGDGVTTALLKKHGVEVFSEDEIEKLVENNCQIVT